ncbi:carboxymuconolactone decarboxylase family protein [Pseudoxanthomonas sp. UTMC 1351]|uniref:carboxymuconolactone decarboxylase family protein n=1 Tax=Pseudoxanthomonas sp. UTMC 1351 TaxID=2695853 RepID=UPI0034CD7AF3
MTITQAVRYEQEIPNVLKALADVHPAIDLHGIDKSLQHLVHLRASQINGCNFCIRMHTREALEDGESQQRLERLADWRQANDFSAREKAAFAWTEALTVLGSVSDYGALRSQLRQHFDENGIAALTASVGMINVWNRIQISRH